METANVLDAQCVCGHANPQGSLYCRGCHALLVGESPHDAPPVAGWRLLDLAEACELSLQGTWDLDTFQTWLAAFREMQEVRASDIHELYAHIPAYLEDDFQDEYEIGAAGLEQCHEALAVLAAARAALTRATIVHAMRLYLRGTCEILDAMAVNRRNAERPLWA